MNGYLIRTKNETIGVVKLKETNEETIKTVALVIEEHFSTKVDVKSNGLDPLKNAEPHNSVIIAYRLDEDIFTSYVTLKPVVIY